MDGVISSHPARVWICLVSGQIKNKSISRLTNLLALYPVFVPTDGYQYLLLFTGLGFTVSIFYTRLLQRLLFKDTQYLPYFPDT